MAEVSTLFVVWSLTGFVLEVPSGAWADVVDRRLLLVVSALVYAVGFATWMLWPTYAGFALGFVLWGASGSLMSGTFESLVYDELAAHGASDRYPALVGRAHATAMAANLVASVAAAPLIAWGGYPLVGWSSVAIAGAQAVLAATLPVTTHKPSGRRPAHEMHDVAVATERMTQRYLAMLRAGFAEAAGTTVVRRMVLLSAAVIGASAYDEYFPLVARDHGTLTATIPWLVGLVVLGQVVGTALAGRTARMSAPTMSWMLLGAAILISVGSLVSPWAGFAAIAVGYGLLNNAMVVAEARLQDVITGPARATVTSVSGLATEVVALAVYLSFAITGGLVSVPVQVAALGVPLAVVAVVARRALPPSTDRFATRRSDGAGP